jgi:tetratricopeptide (TPR) repeat protein
MERIEWMEKYMASAEQMIYQNQVDEGLHLLNGLLYDEPGYANLHNYLGWAYMYYTPNAAQAELHLKMAMRFASNYAPPYLHMGALLNRQGKYSGAISYFDSGLTKPEANRVALLEGMATAYEMRSEYAQAIRTYKEAARSSAVQHEVDRLVKSATRCRKKRLAFFLRSSAALWPAVLRIAFAFLLHWICRHLGS